MGWLFVKLQGRGDRAACSLGQLADQIIASVASARSKIIRPRFMKSPDSRFRWSSSLRRLGTLMPRPLRIC